MVYTEEFLKEALIENFGFDRFKGGQETIIQSVVNKKDTFVIMPTGGGKSLCYQLPAMILEGTALIISPLIALMKNQVDLVRGYCDNDEIAHFLNSSLSRKQTKQVKQDLIDNKTKLLYVAPETLTKEETINFFKEELKISFVAVDEAHCISEWGHDFRPEYRRIREMLDEIDPEIPIAALTATATPKVQEDIVKTLKMREPDIYISSFNRPNLYYEVRPKKKKADTLKDIVHFIKQNEGKSGIIYCLNRKTTEEIAETLNVNGIKAAPYHAGLDSNTRSRIQDQFLMEDIDVIAATIAFGMGIDKPDVRFVLHYDVPKSLENYYQETGRAGRDGLEGKCISYFSHDDINKLDKFLRDKPVKEREIGGQHLLEVVDYSEMGTCRRQFLLHYFGEDYDVDGCNKMCDNCANPREKLEGIEYMKMALTTVKELGSQYRIKYLTEFLIGKRSQDVLAFRHDKKPSFGIGKERDAAFWSSLLRQAILRNFLVKEIEDYGVLDITAKGEAYLENPHSVEITLHHQYDTENLPTVSVGKTVALDQQLLKMLKDIRKQVAKRKNLPPYVIFQDASLNDMATQYPITADEMANIAGVSKGKAIKYGRSFLEFIKEYVEENDIERPNEIVTKQVAQKSKRKVFIIQNIDKQIPLITIASNLQIDMEELMEEMESIVASGTKININYFINDNLDEEQQEEIFDYFMEAESDDIRMALDELDDDEYTGEDIRLMRLKFMSDLAN